MSSVKQLARMAAALGVAATVLYGAAAPVAAAAGSVPWTDPAVTGYLGLCDSNGHPVDSGSLDSAPFVTRAVSSVAAPSPYGESGRTATLYAFQPRQDIPPGQWSGDMLTASTRYSNPAHPMAQATGGDLSLAGFVSEFPPRWDGLIQLRLYLGAPGQPAQTLSYASTTIKVTGSSWSVVSGGNTSCTTGNATSIEQILLPKKSLKVHHSAAGSTPPSPATAPGAASASSAAAGPIGAPANGDLAASRTSDSGGSTNYPELVLIVILAATAGAAGVSWFHRRSQERSS